MTAPLDPALTSAVLGRTTGVAGRHIISARQTHFVADRKPSSGGPGEAIQAAELLLAALVSCATGVIETAAVEAGHGAVSVSIAAWLERDPDDTTRYRQIQLDVAIGSTSPEVARALVATFTATCPIYNTLRRGGPIAVRVIDGFQAPSDAPDGARPKQGRSAHDAV